MKKNNCCANKAIVVTAANQQVRWHPGQEAGSAPPCSNLRSFQNQMYCIEKGICDIVGTLCHSLQ